MYERFELRGLDAIPVGQRSLETEATEYATRVQERERVMIAVLGAAFGALIALAFLRR